ncbi:MAG TPA: hypothetical protein VHI13_11900 [Candidatus Kapabacteria bacterium]|nr:hypothetical protein [Candidatus Kapabacteria bacterium]
MNVQSLRFGMKVKHPAYGLGVVKTIAERTVEIQFEDGAVRTVSPEASQLQPAEPTASIAGLEMPLAGFIAQINGALIDRLGLGHKDEDIDLLGGRWHDGMLVMRPSDASLQSKEVPIETFFHKIVMMRNNLRVLEQKINAHEKLSDAEKVEMQQYITRCYGSMTTFNVLFRDKEDQF